MKTQKYWWLSIAALVGLVSSFWQLMEKLSLLKNSKTALSCNFNSTFNCSNVLSSHQASVFGPPNSVIGIIMFSFFFSIGVVLLSGSKLARNLALMVQGLALFMLGFVLWFLFESTYRIHSICIFCLFIGTATVVINAVMLRHNFGQKIRRWTARGADLFGWALLWLAVGFAIIMKFS